MKRIAAIVVTYNRKDKLRNCIEAILAQTAQIKPDIFIVDNGSSDGTEEWVHSLSKKNTELRDRLIYSNLLHNSGGAGGFNYGIRKAVEAGYGYLWLMDDDCIPLDSALKEFVDFDSRHGGGYGFLSSKVLWKDGSLSRISVQRETMFRNVSDWDNGITDVSMASFASMFLPAGVVLDVGLPIREFFIWTDDWEYSRRISMKYPCYLISDSVVVHDMDTDINAKADIAVAEADRLGRFRYLYRNDVYLYRREGLKGICYEAVRLSYHLARITVSRNSISEKCKRLGILIRGTRAGIGFYPQQERVMPVSDKENKKRSD